MTDPPQPLRTANPTVEPEEQTTETPETPMPTNAPTLTPVMAVMPQTDTIPTRTPVDSSLPISEPTVDSLPVPSTAVVPSVQCGIEGFDTFWNDLGELASYNEAFSNPSSYQCKALGRLAEQQGYEGFSFTTMMQYWVLYCIFFSTNGASMISSERRLLEGGTWINKDGWEEADMDPCSGWYGITCDRLSRVTEIDLSRNGLNGVFPGEIRYLSLDGDYSTGAGSLQKLNVYNNEFLTIDESSWISQLGSALRSLNYGSTGFEGPLPELPLGIEEFDCSYALHSGVLPDSVFQGLNNLTILVLDGNNFVSPIPKSISALPNLQYFYIRDAGLTGDLSYLHGMPSIVEHLVDRNPGLSGTIPTSVASLTTLRSFSASDCSLVSMDGRRFIPGIKLQPNDSCFVPHSHRSEPYRRNSGI
jgi:YD repeat-containing protein